MAIEQIHGCTGCGNCVRACPTDVIRMDPDTGLAVITYQDNCQICHLCRLSCPVDAITLTPDKAISPMVSWA
ncbi:4Fe-4S dicluster domain-containing protein [Cohaesibacter celericrescens]|uniref:[Fe-S]-binding protein n=1 Tax=Cohaesibacter celericrescens TaxID=2067669 RepID=A0A2N5XQY0_9HYPH|nr:4Fe-4S binding protein [Cohaesibacter celericrescens]PLW76875.1 [Fe-S]-binding protein [Cohaesibacter celericrescens]